MFYAAITTFPQTLLNTIMLLPRKLTCVYFHITRSLSVYIYIKKSLLIFFLCVRGGPLPAGRWDATASGAGREPAGAELPGWGQLAPAVPLEPQQQQPYRLDTAVQVSSHPQLGVPLHPSFPPPHSHPHPSSTGLTGRLSSVRLLVPRFPLLHSSSRFWSRSRELLTNPPPP